MTIPNIDLESTYNELTAIHNEMDALKKREAEIKNTVANAFAEEFQQKLITKPEPYGKVTVHLDNFQLQYDVTKVVIWDQEKLRSIYKMIADSGDNPEEFIKVKYDVSETAYKAWPQDIKDVFAEARTVKPGSAKVSLLNMNHEE